MKSPGQTALEAFNQAILLPIPWQDAFHLVAREVLAAHTPKITAEDISIGYARMRIGENFKDLAEFLNARLSLPQPASVEESRPVEAEWDIFPPRTTDVRVGDEQSYDGMKTWNIQQAAVSGESNAGIIRRPKKINPQPEGGENMPSDMKFPSDLTQPAKESNPPEAGAPASQAEWDETTGLTGMPETPSAESGETPEADKFFGDLSNVRDSEILAARHFARTLERQRDKARQELAEVKELIYCRNPEVYPQDAIPTTWAEIATNSLDSEKRLRSKLTTAQSQAEKDRATIERLNKELSTAQAKAGSPWVRCDERMPTKEDEDRNGEVMWFSGEGPSAVIRINDWKQRFLEAPTHWAPIPPLPNPSPPETKEDAFEAFMKKNYPDADRGSPCWDELEEAFNAGKERA